MWRRLQNEGIRIAYSTVCQYVRALKAMPPQTDRPAKAYIRQGYEPGFRCEFDWGVVTLWLGGVRTRLQIAVFTLDYSNMRKAYLFSREDTLALMEAHRNCFRELGGTPRMMAYDNMRTAVKNSSDATASIRRPCCAWRCTTVSRCISAIRVRDGRMGRLNVRWSISAAVHSRSRCVLILWRRHRRICR